MPRTDRPAPGAGPEHRPVDDPGLRSIQNAIVAHRDGAVLAVVAVPRSGITAFAPPADGALRVRLAAPPVDGTANAALLRFLADALRMPRSRLRLLAGATARRKRVLVAGLTPAELAARLVPHLSRHADTRGPRSRIPRAEP